VTLTMNMMMIINLRGLEVYNAICLMKRRKILMGMGTIMGNKRNLSIVMVLVVILSIKNQACPSYHREK
jgi:uncharacterized membrane protein